MTTINISDTAYRLAYDLRYGETGGTASLVVGIQPPTTGYAVSLFGLERKLPFTPPPNVNGLGWRDDRYNEIESYAKEFAAVLTLPNHYLGLWVDGDTLYLDITQVFVEFDTALRSAIQRRQLAIYSFATGNEIQIAPGRRTTVTDEQQAADVLLRNIREEYGQTEEAALTTTDVEGTLAYATGKTDTPPADWGSKLNDAGQVEPDPETVGAPSPFDVVGAAEYDVTTDELSTLIDGDPWRGEDRVHPWNAAPPLSNETARQAWGTLSAKGREALRAFWLDNA